MKAVKNQSILLVFKPKKYLSQAERTDIRRKLYGFTDFSSFGRYRYLREGLLAKIPHQRIMRGVLLIRKQDCPKVLAILKGKANVYIGEYQGRSL